jgi:hypothetical protein
MRSIKVPLLFQDDFTYEAGQLAMWTAAEMSVTIIAASIPVLRTVIKSMVTNKSSNQSGNTGTFRNRTHTTIISGPGGDRSHLRMKGGSSGGDGESTESLGLPRHDHVNGIVKSESVMVDYDYDTSRPATHNAADPDVFGYEMDHVPVRKSSSRSRI